MQQSIFAFSNKVVFLRTILHGCSILCHPLIALCIDPRREQAIVQSILLLSIVFVITRGRMDTCRDSFGRSTPPVALVFFGTWRKRRITSSRSSPSVFMGKVKPARKSIFAPSRRRTVSPPTVLTKVGAFKINRIPANKLVPQVGK